MHWGKLFLVLIVFGIFGTVGVPPAQAQHQLHEFEVTPFGGVRFGGEIDLNTADVDYLPIHSSANYGALLDYTIWPGFQAEFLWNQQPTFLGVHSVSTDTTLHLTSADLTTYNWGFNYSFRSPESKLRPFIAAGLGFTHFAAGQYSSRNFLDFGNRFSYNFGVGAKYFFTDHVGLRMEARWLPSRTTAGTGQYQDPYTGFVYPVATHNHAEQGSADIGIIFRFR